MIPVGTLCLLLAPHSRAGQVCTVVSPPSYRNCWVDNVAHGLDLVHNIEISGETYSLNGRLWGARPSELRPLNDPDNARDFSLPKPELAEA